METEAYPTMDFKSPNPRRSGTTAPLRHGPTVRLIVLLLCGLSGFGGIVFYALRGAPGTTFSTPYQAVLLSNGAIFYGKLHGYGTSQPVLTDMYYIVSSTNQETKQTSNVLVKRGKELHSPDRMYLNPNSIIFVETVGSQSKVAQLISQAQ